MSSGGLHPLSPVVPPRRIGPRPNGGGVGKQITKERERERVIYVLIINCIFKFVSLYVSHL